MHTFEELREIVGTLRSEEGCPWDREQTFESLKTCLGDEMQEVFWAVDRGDRRNLCEELGDVLFLLVLYSRIGEEMGDFSLDEVIDGICRKMVRRHPHVFGSVKIHSLEEAHALWKQIKLEEKAKNP